jgi:RES domain-containing protein
MIVFRIEREKYLDTTLTRIGASMSEGYRWNSLNIKIIYTSETRPLATLEISVHLDLSEDLSDDRFYVEIEIPNEIVIQEVALDDLPDDWNSKPPTLTTHTIGDDFVNYNIAAILKAPSSIVPQEFNYLIKPGHQDLSKIKVLSTLKMIFDSRFKGKKD